MKRVKSIFVATMLLGALTLGCEKKQEAASSPVVIEEEETPVEQIEVSSNEDESFNRREEILSEVDSWLSNWQEELSEYIAIDNNPYNIVYDDFGEEFSSIREFDGVDLVFLETHNDSEEGVGWFLLKAICYNNGEDYPECLPFKIDDSMEVVLEAFGEKSEAYEADEETSYRWEKRGGDLFIEVSPEGGLVQTVTICKEGW